MTYYRIQWWHQLHPSGPRWDWASQWVLPFGSDYRWARQEDAAAYMQGLRRREGNTQRYRLVRVTEKIVKP